MNSPQIYSVRSASIGSTLEALRDGIQQVSSEIVASSRGTTVNVAASQGAMPYSRLRVSFAPANASGTPSTIAMTTSRSPPRTTIACTCEALAPNAMRTPISFVRWLTA